MWFTKCFDRTRLQSLQEIVEIIEVMIHISKVGEIIEME